jgi:hypothetical protein
MGSLAQVKSRLESNRNRTSYVTAPPEIDVCRSVTLEIAPFADRMHTPRGPCCENDMILDAMSFMERHAQSDNFDISQHEKEWGEEKWKGESRGRFGLDHDRSIDRCEIDCRS